MNRDSEDTRVIKQYLAHGPGGPWMGNTYNGPTKSPAVPAGTPCTISGTDGIPDSYKTSVLKVSATANVGSQVASNGYTNLENYLNGSASSSAPAPTPAPTPTKAPTPAPTPIATPPGGPGPGVGTTPNPPSGVRIEAESSANTLAGGAQAFPNECASCSGKNEVGDIGGANGGSLTFNTVRQSAAGNYTNQDWLSRWYHRCKTGSFEC